MSDESRAKFRIGQTVHHQMFDYRGVVFDVDSEFMGSDQWYEAMAKSRPPKDLPWYHVLVHGAEHTTYVAQRNLERDDTNKPVMHPLIDEIFNGVENGVYILRQSLN